MDAIGRIVTEIRRCMGESGFMSVEDEERTRSYLLRRFPGEERAVRACVKVLFLDRYLDALMWLWFEPRTATMRDAYRYHYERRIREEIGEAGVRDLMLQANTVFMSDEVYGR